MIKMQPIHAIIYEEISVTFRPAQLAITADIMTATMSVRAINSPLLKIVWYLNLRRPKLNT